jgi:hypothetical protein
MDAARRLNVTLEPEHAEKLRALAQRTHVKEGTLARSLLAAALDRADPDPTQVTALLDGIPGALERARDAERAAARGEAIALEDL